LRCLVAIADTGSFTDAAIDLGVSQAAVSRTLASLETGLGVRLLRRTSREVALTAAGARVLAAALRALAAADDVVQAVRVGNEQLLVGYAWAAMGRHTTTFQRRWAADHPDVELHLVRTNSETAGLAEGACDVAVLRREADERRFRSVLVGVERRYCAMAADDPWAARRSVRMSEISSRVLVIDRRTGTTAVDLWPAAARPAVQYTADIDDWLAVIAAGGVVGVTPESTVAQYPRPGIVFRPVRDAPPVPVRVAWWRDDPHPSAEAVAGLLTTLYA
jgi:DNA-binding transcriptional LysR family regulator